MMSTTLGKTPVDIRKTGTGGRKITVLQDIDIAESDLGPPRARGRVALTVKAVPQGTGLDHLHQSGCLKLLFPRVFAGSKQAVVVNTSGGITGGDQLDIRATAQAGTDLTLTTQAAERAYLAQPGAMARLDSRLAVEDGARLNWLPQETILFNGCALQRSLRVDLAPTARLLMAEPLVFGRAAMGETLIQGRFHDRIDIRRGGRPLYLDALRLEGDIAARLAQPFCGNGAGAMVSLVYVAPDAEAQVSRLRPDLPDTGGASLLGPDMMVLRLLAKDSFTLRQSLVPMLNHLTHNTLPRPWMT